VPVVIKSLVFPGVPTEVAAKRQRVSE
jgi:hypothetical protein